MTLSHTSQGRSGAPPNDTFAFGRNWQRYVSTYLNAARKRLAQDALARLVGPLRDKTFIDIGCGSGLFSLCAYQAGARQVLSFDVDPDAVTATRALRASVGSPASWQVRHASILDPATLRDVVPADVVYSWGVLHHTGDLYRAIRNSAALVAPGGLFAIAIYNRVTGRFLNSVRWRGIKRTYNRAPRRVQAAMEGLYAAYWFVGRIANKRNPVQEARAYGAERGMALWTDLVDWLGGYPYEYATPGEIVEFCRRTCGLTSLEIRSVPANDLGNNEFVFARLGPNGRA